MIHQQLISYNTVISYRWYCHAISNF